MKRKQNVLLGVSIICLIVFLGGLYFALSGYGLATQPIAMKMEQQGPITLMCKKRIVLH